MHNSHHFNQNSHFVQENSWSKNNNSDYSRQKKLDDERKKQQYKMAAEQALDNIVNDYLNALANNLENWTLNSSDKASVVRYSKRYWDNSFFTSTLFVMLVTFILSFYSTFAVLGILVVFLLREVFSQRILLAYLLNDHELTRQQISVIKDKIFYKQLKTSFTAIITATLILLSYGCFFITKPIYLMQDISPDKIQKMVNILSKFYPFHLENELFAYINVGSILILILLKLYEKWSK